MHSDGIAVRSMTGFGAPFSRVVLKEKLEILSVFGCRNIFPLFISVRSTCFTFGLWGPYSSVTSVTGSVRAFVIVVVLVGIEVIVVLENAVWQNVVGSFLGL